MINMIEKQPFDRMLSFVKRFQDLHSEKRAYHVVIVTELGMEILVYVDFGCNHVVNMFRRHPDQTSFCEFWTRYIQTVTVFI